MTMPFLDLLIQIRSGIEIFEPFYRNKEGMREFQDLVHRLQEMERAGLVSHVFTQVRQRAGEENIDLAMVRGGLTAEGERLLAEHQD